MVSGNVRTRIRRWLKRWCVSQCVIGAGHVRTSSFSLRFPADWLRFAQDFDLTPSSQTSPWRPRRADAEAHLITAGISLERSPE